MSTSSFFVILSDVCICNVSLFTANANGGLMKLNKTYNASFYVHIYILYLYQLQCVGALANDSTSVK